MNSEYDGGKSEVEQPEEDYMICPKCSGFMPMLYSEMEDVSFAQTGIHDHAVIEVYECEECGFIEEVTIG